MRLIAQSVASAGQPAGWGGGWGLGGGGGQRPRPGEPRPQLHSKAVPREAPQPGSPARPKSPPVLDPASPLRTTFCSILGCPLGFGGPGFSIPLCPPVFLCPPLSCLFGFACLFLSICLSMSVCPSLSLSFSLCQPVLPSSLSVHLISLCLLTGFSLLLYISLLLPSLDLPAIPLSHCPSVHMASVSVSRAICTGVFPLAQPLSVQQQSFCLPYSVPTVYGQTPLCPPSSPIPP